MNTDDNELIDRCLAGETAAFAVLVEEYQPRLFGAVARLLRSANDAADITQEAFLLAFQNLRTFRRSGRFYSWLFRIGYNAAMTHLRQKQLRPQSLYRQELDGDLEIPDGREDSPESALEDAEEAQAVRTALNELSDEFRIPLILKEFEGLSYEEIAENLGCPIGTVRSRIFRGRQELRERLNRQLKRESPPANVGVNGTANRNTRTTEHRPVDYASRLTD